jgi:hypothetical protein
MERLYQNLANAIVIQAVKDYEDALIREHQAKKERKEIEEFFTGDNIKEYTSVDGNVLIETIRKKIARNGYKPVLCKEERK